MTYAREMKAPQNKEEGLQNFVQMIINCLEAGDHREALLKAVDLHQDLTTGIYREVVAPELNDAVPMAEHLRAVENARVEGSDAGMRAGANAVRAELKRLLGGSPLGSCAS
jgi:hypothetical protein